MTGDGTGASPAPRPGGAVKAYGDTTDDGMIQVSFTLPMPAGPRAEGAAALYAKRLGLDPVLVTHAKAMGPDFTFFIVYGRSQISVDPDEVVVREREFPLLTGKEVDGRIKSGLGRKLVVLGATVGTDAHTVGIDAILNVKGFAGEKGLEHHREMRVVNLGSQVDVEDLVSRAEAEHADAVLVSQVVTQKDAHLVHARMVSSAFAGRPTKPLIVVGGPRFDPEAAGELGVDRIFGKGTTPGEVASYLVHALVPSVSE